jgi:hypothetical protein
MEEMGLAGQGSVMGQDVGKIIAMLQQGATPEELVQAGVPIELIQEAMRILAQEATAMPNQGLAGMQVPRAV